MKKLIYIKSFTAKQELVVEPVPGRVFMADQIGNSYSIRMDENTDMIIHEGITDNGNFSCEAVVVTKNNYKSLKLHKEDKKLAEQLFREDLVKKAVNQAEDNFEKQLDKAFEEFGTLVENDPFILISLAKVASHVNKTYSDKYNTDFPEIELNGLMRHSKHGKGFNIGNASKYLRRYFTEGFSKSSDPDDLLKASHYILMELDRRDNEI